MNRSSRIFRTGEAGERCRHAETTARRGLSRSSTSSMSLVLYIWTVTRNGCWGVLVVKRPWDDPFRADTQELTHVTPGGGFGRGSEISNRRSKISVLLSPLCKDDEGEHEAVCGGGGVGESPQMGYKSTPPAAVWRSRLTQFFKCRRTSVAMCWDASVAFWNQLSFFACMFKSVVSTALLWIPRFDVLVDGLSWSNWASIFCSDRLIRVHRCRASGESSDCINMASPVCNMLSNTRGSILAVIAYKCRMKCRRRSSPVMVVSGGGGGMVISVVSITVFSLCVRQTGILWSMCGSLI